MKGLLYHIVYYLCPIKHFHLAKYSSTLSFITDILIVDFVMSFFAHAMVSADQHAHFQTPVVSINLSDQGSLWIDFNSFVINKVYP